MLNKYKLIFVIRKIEYNGKKVLFIKIYYVWFYVIGVIRVMN